MSKNDCIFCKIVKGEIPSTTLYQDDDVQVIMDVGPASKGHILVLPKEHFDDIYDISEAAAAKTMKVTRQMAAKLQKAMNCEGMNLVQNNGILAGQTVVHFHLHLIPRYENDGVNIGWEPGEVSQEDRDKLLTMFTQRS